MARRLLRAMGAPVRVAGGMGREKLQAPYFFGYVRWAAPAAGRYGGLSPQRGQRKGQAIEPRRTQRGAEEKQSEWTAEDAEGRLRKNKANGPQSAQRGRGTQRK